MVDHSRDWVHGGYVEIQNNRRKCILIDAVENPIQPVTVCLYVLFYQLYEFFKKVTTKSPTDYGIINPFEDIVRA